jgi:hypothetical protein
MIVPTLLVLLCADEPLATATNSSLSVVHREVGQGFRKHSPSLEVKLTRAFGTTETGSSVAHHLWLTQIQGGLMLTDVLAENWFFAGNLEGLAQFLAGGQDRPESAYFLGLNSGLRYHFRTGTRFDPFIGGSVGIAGTDVGEPDLGGKFQFNQQIGAGTRFFLTEHHALTFEYAYWHVSNGGIREPNDGINAHLFSIGFAWQF